MAQTTPDEDVASPSRPATPTAVKLLENGMLDAEPNDKYRPM
jgi:hypothetical protein